MSNVSLRNKRCFWLLLNGLCRRPLKQEGLWQLNHWYEEQIARGEVVKHSGLRVPDCLRQEANRKLKQGTGRITQALSTF